MGIFNSLFPYTDFHRLNADWILEKVRKASEDAAGAAEDAAESAEAVETFDARLTEAEEDASVARSIAEGAVRYDTSQALSDPQKEQALTNIGAADAMTVDAIGETLDTTRTTANLAYNHAMLAVLFDPDQGLSSSQQAAARNNIDAASTSSVGAAMDAIMALNNVAVRVNSSQSFTDAQKAQARANIGAASVDATIAGAVMYSSSQSLSSAEKLQARTNIGALGPVAPTITTGFTVENAAQTNRFQTTILDRSGTCEFEFSDGNADPIIISGVDTPRLTYDAANKLYVDSKQLQRQAVTGSTPSITPSAGYMYTCGEVTSLTVNSVPATGEVTIRFQSGSTPATLALPADVLMPDAFAVEADRYYEINILDKWGVAASWEVEVVT